MLLISCISLLFIGQVHSLWTNECGLRMEVFINNDETAYIRCTDTTGSSNPLWRVNNLTDYHPTGIAQLKLFGMSSFTVLSLNWRFLPQGHVTVECVAQSRIV